MKPCAFITGASSGIGAAFARRCAEKGYDLLITARRHGELEKHATALREQYGTTVTVIAADLSTDAGRSACVDALGKAPRCELLVNAAGFGIHKPFSETPPRTLDGMVALHMETPTLLCRTVLPAMLEANRGAIINISSIAAFLKTGHGLYNATKMYLLELTRTIANDVAFHNARGVHVQALCPGYTRSGFHDTEAYRTFMRSSIPAFMWMEADAVARFSLQTVNKKSLIAIPGITNHLLVLLMRMGVQPKRLLNRIRHLQGQR